MVFFQSPAGQQYQTASAWGPAGSSPLLSWESVAFCVAMIYPDWLIQALNERKTRLAYWHQDGNQNTVEARP